MNADVPETRHVGAAATEQLQQHVLDLLGELVRLVDDQHRRIEVHVRVVEGRQRLAEDQVFARELSRLRIPERSSRDQFLPDHLRLGFAIPRIEHVGHRQIVHTLQIEAGQIAALRQRFGQRGLAAAAWPLDEQRLAAAERDYIFFDEPTTGLDPIGVYNICHLMRRLQEEGKTTLMVTHDMETAFAVSEKYSFIHKAHLIFDGGREEMLHSDLPEIREFLKPTDESIF